MARGIELPVAVPFVTGATVALDVEAATVEVGTYATVLLAVAGLVSKAYQVEVAEVVTPVQDVLVCSTDVAIGVDLVETDVADAEADEETEEDPPPVM